MPIIQTLEEAKRLRDRAKTQHERIGEWRQVRDRKMDNVLGSIRAILPPRAADLFIPVQSQEPDDEVQARKQVLASNEAEIEVLSRSSDAKTLRLAQQLEDAFDALHEAFWPIDVQLDECDGILGDGMSVLALDYLGPGPALAEYADREALQQGAEQPDPDADGAQGAYNDAYQACGCDHEKAYNTVTTDAMVRDGLRYRVRVLNTLVFDAFEDIDGVSFGMEDAEVEMHPALEALENYGVEMVGTQLVLTRDGKATDDAALSRGMTPVDGNGVINHADQLTKVRFTQMRTREQIIILVEGVGRYDTSGEGIFITQPNPLDNHTGYFILEGDTKLRGTGERRQPVILGLLETHQRANMLKSLGQAMSLDEASRDIYQPGVTAGVQPVDATQEVKAQALENGSIPPEVPEMKRVETTGIDIERLIELVDAETERYRMHQFFAGSGNSGESGIHFARLQTVYQMRLQPYQTKRAGAHKRVLVEVQKAAAKNDETIYIPYLPAETRGVDAGVRVAQPRTITPEMAQLAVDLQVTIGAESPETKYAAAQMSQTQTAFGTWSMTSHRENCGVKDPQAEEARILEDNIVSDAIGAKGNPGWMVPFVRQAAQQQLVAYIQSLLPQPPQPMMAGQPGTGAPMAAGAGPVPDQVESPNGVGPAYVPPPTQVQAGGTPVSGGVPGTPV